MSKLKEKTWADYELKNFSRATRIELQSAVRKAAKAANQRLLRLERHNQTRGAYQLAQRFFKDTGRRRYKERPANLTYNELQKEYKALRSFLSAKGSTIQGAMEIDKKRFETARAKGYGGTFEQFRFDLLKAFSKLNESLFSSNVIYESVISGDVDILVETAEQFRNNKENGKALLIYMRLRRKKKG